MEHLVQCSGNPRTRIRDSYKVPQFNSSCYMDRMDRCSARLRAIETHLKGVHPNQESWNVGRVIPSVSVYVWMVWWLQILRYSACILYLTIPFIGFKFSLHWLAQECAATCTISYGRPAAPDTLFARPVQEVGWSVGCHNLSFKCFSFLYNDKPSISSLSSFSPRSN